MALLPTVCVIGAGSSGIAAVKALHEHGFAFDCFEASDHVGGNWCSRTATGCRRRTARCTSTRRASAWPTPTSRCPRRIAVEASFSARATYLAARRGAWVIPKYLFGRPLDTLGASPRIPIGVRRRAEQAMIRLAVGEMERYGLPRPDHRFGQAHPTVSDDVLSRIAHGAITPKPNLAELSERSGASRTAARSRPRSSSTAPATA